MIKKNCSITEEYVNSCRDACGDEDNCCEYGIDMIPSYQSVSLKEMIDTKIA